MPTTIQLPAAGGSPLPARRRRGRRYPAVARGRSCARVSALALGGQVMIQEDQTQFTADGVRELVINQDAGDITLLAGSTAAQVRVTTSRTWSWQQPPSTRFKDGVLTLTGESCRFLELGTSDVDQEIMVPAGITIRADVSAGNIQANGLDAPHFEVKTVSGSIDATDVDATFFSATTNSGGIKASLFGATERVNAHAIVGSVISPSPTPATTSTLTPCQGRSARGG